MEHTSVETAHSEIKKTTPAFVSDAALGVRLWAPATESASVSARALRGVADGCRVLAARA